MKVSTIRCERCRSDHGLLWVVGANGRKTLSYRCNKVPVEIATYGMHKGEVRHRTKIFAVPDHLRPKSVHPDIPVEWSPKLRKKEQEDHQPALPL